MTFDPDRHHRHSIRLAGFDYSSAGAYFVTICVRERECVFGEVVADTLQLNARGQCVVDAWQGMAARFSSVVLDAFVVMPNHVHGVIFLNAPNQEPGAASSAPTHAAEPGAASSAPTQAAEPSAASSAPTQAAEPGAASSAPTQAGRPGLGDVIRAFKSISAIAVNRIRSQSGQPLWQRNYFERVIRDADELERVRKYISDNPANWCIDEENPLMPSPQT